MLLVFRLIVATLVFLKVSCSPVNLALEGAWKGWKETHAKGYLEEEEAFRRTVWEKNLWRIERHNLEAARGKHSFQLAMNHLGDLTDEEFNQMLNGFQPQEAEQYEEGDVDFQESATAETPKQVDWRTKGYVTPVKDQVVRLELFFFLHRLASL
ncbi:cathepsin L1-like [Pseudonaja textilis]|uniref:cathepsin L1-like n=1 Tax=Pseudonaja textilis TaxID=8673 RepID=UPI000EAA306A|nr:cathepsin L1-like [Pseudonaja textilis]XP_026580297.1 cathepsin L1-like [Pseudonaja textilis]